LSKAETDKLIIDVDFNELPDNKRAIIEVYNLISKTAGVDPDKVKEYDCRKIDYRLNAEKLIFEKAGTEVDKVQVCVALAMNGMKVDKSLADNKAIIYRGGITMANGKDILDVVDTKSPELNDNNSFEKSVHKAIDKTSNISKNKGGNSIDR